MDIVRLSITAFLIAAGGLRLAADTTPVMVSLLPPVSIPSRHWDVAGLRLSLLYGECRDFMGLDIGVSNYAVEEFMGLGVGGVNIARERFYGVQAGLVNWNACRGRSWSSRSMGAQVGLLNCSHTLCGLQSGPVNVVRSDIVGLQTGLLNIANDIDGVQAGYYAIFGANVALGSVRGCQVGLVNYAERMEGGLQVGLINICRKRGWLPVLPIVNGRF